MFLAAIIFAVVLVFANSYTTWLVLNQDSLDPEQKFWQVAVVWVIPFVGAYLIFSFILTDKDKTNALSTSSSTNDTAPTEFDVLDNFARSSSNESFDGE